MTNVFRAIYAWMFLVLFTSVNGTATLILPTPVNCGDQAVLTCTSTDCNIAYIFTKSGTTIYNKGGPISTNDSGRYFATVTSNSQVKLTITNLQPSDAGDYRCVCGFDNISSIHALQYQCLTSSVEVTPIKQLQITIDRLYLMPSNIDTRLNSSTVQLLGNYTCETSPTLASLYMCTWLSTESLLDGYHGYTTAVTTGTQVSFVSGSFRLVTPTSPSINNLVTITNNSQVLRGIENTPLTIECVSRGGIPAPTLAWYRDNTKTTHLAQSNTSNSVQQSDGTYTVALTYNFTPSRTDDMATVLCRAFYPGATTGASPDPIPATAILYLDISAVILSLPNITVVEGEPNFALTCSASSKPPAIFTWFKGNMVLTTGTGTHETNSFSYVISRVDRTHDGSYRCQADNNVGGPDSEIVHLIVTYPPTVTVSTTSAQPYTVTCKASGFPDSYTYRDWVQVWPGYGPVATIPFNGTILTLTDVTYESSGVYVCSASNGVALYGTDTTFMNGNGTVLAKAAPVPIDPPASDIKKPVAGEQGKNISIDIVYWSNIDGSVVRCYHYGGGARHLSSSCSVVETDTEVTLPVYNHRVSETGKLATVTIPIKSKDDLGDYGFVVTNTEAGEAVLNVLISAPDSPATPSLIRVYHLSNEPIIMVVTPGFHGGYSQTLVAQFSTDQVTWDNVTSRNIGYDEQTTVLTVSNMQTSTLYYVRVFAFNIKGRSRGFSAIMAFTIHTEKDEQQEMSPAVYISITATVAVCLTLILTVMVIICACRCCPDWSDGLILHLGKCVSKNNSWLSEIHASYQVRHQETKTTTVCVVKSKYANPDVPRAETNPSYEHLQETGQQFFYSELQ